MTASDEVQQITKGSIVTGRACGHGFRCTVGATDGSGRGGSKQQHSPENCSREVLEPRTEAPMMRGNDPTVVGKESCDSVNDDVSDGHDSADGGETQDGDNLAGDTQEDDPQNTQPNSKTKKPRNSIVIISEKDQDKIGEFLLANDFLYNRHRDQRRDTQSRERNWEELSELIGRDAKDIKQWYQSTRSKLSDIKKKKVTPSGSGFEVEGVTDKARTLWERFQFLLPNIVEVKVRTVGPDFYPPISVSSDHASNTRPPLVLDPKRAKVVDTSPDEGIQALVCCSQQLMVVGDKLARYL